MIVLNFEFGSLGFVCDLIFGAWNFLIILWQPIFEHQSFASLNET
jgi:hypothetical protein